MTKYDFLLVLYHMFSEIAMCTKFQGCRRTGYPFPDAEIMANAAGRFS